jgi:hypothetical protein
VIEREAGGVPTGLLKEAARQLVVRLVPEPTVADIARRIDDIGVIPRAAGKAVIAGPAIQKVTSVAAVKRIASWSSAQGVVPIETVNYVVANSSSHGVS